MKCAGWSTRCKAAQSEIFRPARPPAVLVDDLVARATDASQDCRAARPVRPARGPADGGMLAVT